MNDYSNMVLLDKRDLFDAVRGALKEQMEALPFGDAADLWAEATSAADECLRDLVSKAPVPPAGDVKGVDFGFDDRSVRVSQEAYSIFIAREKHLTAERDGLLGNCADLSSRVRELEHKMDYWKTQNDALQSELTKARELLTVNARDFEGVRRSLAAFHKDNPEQWCGYLDDSLGICLFRIKELAAFLAHQSAPSTPIAHNVDESCGQDAEAAKGGA